MVLVAPEREDRSARAERGKASVSRRRTRDEILKEFARGSRERIKVRRLLARIADR